MPCANDTLRVSVDAARNSVAARTLAPRPPSPTRFSGFSLNIPLFFTHSRISQIRHPRLQAGLGPAASFSAAQSLEHPFASAPPLHPLYARALEAHRLEAGSLRALVLGRLAHWIDIAQDLSTQRQEWLSTLPPHTQSMHRRSGFHGPLFRAMHDHLVSRGYKDPTLSSHVGSGFPSGIVLPRSGCWPEAPDVTSRLSQRLSLSSCCKTTPERLRAWGKCLRATPHTAFLVRHYEAEASSGRCKELQLQEVLAKDHCLIHPCFAINQGDKVRDIRNCTQGYLNACTVSLEKLVLPSTEDPLDFAARLRQLLPGSELHVALADEAHAFRNWPAAKPSLHIAAIPGARDAATGLSSFRFFEDYALCFGDAANVYNYGRVRTFLSVFMCFEFFIPVWSYFDDSMMVARKEVSDAMWYAFLRMHKLLRIPIKGNPLDDELKADARKLRPPRRANICLGISLDVNSTPCTSRPTSERVTKSIQLLEQVLRDNFLGSALAASLVGKLSFLGSTLYGRVGFPAIAVLSRRQHEECDTITVALASSIRFLLELLHHVKPCEWPWHANEAGPVLLLGDAAENATNQTCAAILCIPRQGISSLSVYAFQRPLSTAFPNDASTLTSSSCCGLSWQL